MNDDFGLDELNELLEEKFVIEDICFPNPNFNPNAYQREGIKYIFLNGEKFEGKIEENKLLSGLYEWPNGQKFKGIFSPDNNFKRGEITFPSENKLKMTYNEEKRCFENCTYETNNMIYEGNIQKNKLHGFSMIQSKPNELLYSFKGKYYEGKRNGKFELNIEKNNIKYKINGIYKNGKKSGNFKVINENNNQIIFDYNFINDIISIENDKIDIIKKDIDINCINVLIKGNNLILILAINNKICLYNLIREIYLKEFIIFPQGKILDIIVLKDNKILLSNDENKLKLIDIKIDRGNINLNIFQEFTGRDNSLKIFALLELNNGLIISGDCANLIFWKKINSINNNEIINQSGNSLNINNNNNEQSIFDSLSFLCNNCLENVLNFINGEQEIEIENYNLEKLYNINSTRIYSFIEIKNNFLEKNNFLLSVAQPDNSRIILYEFSYINDIITIINEKTINNINTIINRKNIMTYKDNILYVCCNDSIKLINISNINNIFIIKNILSEGISYINIYQNDFLFCAINIHKTAYNFESNLILNLIEENDIIPTYEKSQHRHNGTIINILFFNYKKKEYIISLGTDKKIIITNNIYKSLEKHNLNNIGEKYNILNNSDEFIINNNVYVGHYKWIEEENINLGNSNLINNNIE